MARGRVRGRVIVSLFSREYHHWAAPRKELRLQSGGVCRPRARPAGQCQAQLWTGHSELETGPYNHALWVRADNIESRSLNVIVIVNTILTFYEDSRPFVSLLEKNLIKVAFLTIASYYVSLSRTRSIAGQGSRGQSCITDTVDTGADHWWPGLTPVTGHHLLIMLTFPTLHITDSRDIIHGQSTFGRSTMPAVMMTSFKRLICILRWLQIDDKINGIKV